MCARGIGAWKFVKVKRCRNTERKNQQKKAERQKHRKTELQKLKFADSSNRSII